MDKFPSRSLLGVLRNQVDSTPHCLNSNCVDSNQVDSAPHFPFAKSTVLSHLIHIFSELSSKLIIFGIRSKVTFGKLILEEFQIYKAGTFRILSTYIQFPCICSAHRNSCVVKKPTLLPPRVGFGPNVRRLEQVCSTRVLFRPMRFE